MPPEVSVMITSGGISSTGWWSQPGVHSLILLPAMHTGDELQVVNIPGPAVKKGKTLAPYTGEDRLASACADGDRAWLRNSRLTCAQWLQDLRLQKASIAMSSCCGSSLGR